MELPNSLFGKLAVMTRSFGLDASPSFSGRTLKAWWTVPECYARAS